MEYEILSGRAFQRKEVKDRHKWVLQVRIRIPGRVVVTKNKTVHAVSKSEAQKKLFKWQEKLEDYDALAEVDTLAAFADKYLDHAAEVKDWSPRTVNSYKRINDLYIKPMLGKKKLTDITAEMISDFIFRLSTDEKDVKQRRGKSKVLNVRTVKSIYYLLSQIMKTAYQWERIPINPMDRIPTPKGRPRRPQVFSEDILRKILMALTKQNPEFQFQVLLDVTTGCRIGELMGLSWDDYNERNHTFLVHQTVQYTAEKGTYLYPRTKTENSKRYIYVIPQLRPILERKRKEYEALRKSAPESWNPYHLIFYTYDGKPVRPNTVSNNFSHFIKKNGIEHIRFHDLRGYFATMLMRCGYSLPDIIKKTGHSKASTLLDYYGHALRESEEKMNQSITESFNNLPRNLLEQ